ncbi:MAG: PAS domain S-box protein [Melioribacteraceae bacterium]
MADLALILKELQQELVALREGNAKLKESYEKQKEEHQQKVESLKSSESNYHKLYSMMRLMSDTMPDMLWAQDRDKKFLFVNESMCKNLLNACDTFEPIGKTNLFFAQRERESHPEDPTWYTFGELCMDSDTITLKEMKPMQFNEFGNVKGKFLFLDVHKAPLFNSKGELLGIVGSARDITARREIDQELSKSENLFRSIWDNSLDGMRLTDKSGIVVKVNQAFCNLVNKSKDELENKSLSEVYKPELREHIHSSHIKNYKNNAIKPYVEKEFVLWDNRKKWFAVSNAYLNPATEDSLVLGIFRDITKNKKSKTALLDSEKNYRTLVENMQEGMLVVDNNDTILFVNPTFCDLTGYTKQDLIGKIGYEVLVGPSLHELIIKKNIERLSGVREQYELEMIKKDGEKILFLMNAVPIKDINNIVIGSFATCIDITKRKEVEEMLSASETKFRHILNISPIPMALNDNHRKITYLNPAFIRTYGYTLEDIPTIDDWWPKAYPDLNYREWVIQVWEEELERTKKTGYEFKPLEVVVKCKNGTDKTILISSSIYPSHPGNDLVVAFFDITDRKLAEEALRESEDRYKAISQYSNNAICIVDESAKVEWVNHQMLTVSGYTEEEILNAESFASFIAPESQKFIFSNFQKVLLGEEYIHHYEFYLIHADGSKRLYEKYMMHYTDKHGKLKLLIDMTDITDRRMAEKALQQTNQKLEAMIAASPDGIGMLTLDGRMLLISDKLAKMNGYTYEESKEVLGKSVFEFIDPSCHQLLKDNIKKLFEGKADKKLSEYIAIRKDKSRFNIDINSSILYDQDGKATSMLFIERDITERKRVEEELEKHRKHLEELVKERTAELNKANVSLRREIEKQKEFEMLLKNSLTKEKELSMMKSSFISTASHEFRTPLTSILSSSEMLQRYKKRWDDAKKDEHFDRIKRQVDYLTKLLDDVLLISKTESGRIEYNPSEVNIRQLIEDSLKESKAQMQESHKVVKKFTCEKNTFNVDGKLMRFIISNLLSNAIKFSPNGGKIEIKTDCNAKDLKLAISDQGIGLAPEDVNKIFQSFYRASNVGAISGTGLGLSIVHHAVELHGGKIIVKSELGKGTTFEVSIPLKKKRTVEEVSKKKKK